MRYSVEKPDAIEIFQFFYGKTDGGLCNPERFRSRRHAVGVADGCKNLHVPKGHFHISPL
jgi:hypothetical protein